MTLTENKLLCKLFAGIPCFGYLREDGLLYVNKTDITGEDNPVIVRCYFE